MDPIPEAPASPPAAAPVAATEPAAAAPVPRRTWLKYFDDQHMALCMIKEDTRKIAVEQARVNRTQDLRLVTTRVDQAIETAILYLEYLERMSQITDNAEKLAAEKALAESGVKVEEREQIAFPARG